MDLFRFLNQLLKKLPDVVRRVGKAAHSLSRLAADISEITVVLYRESDQQLGARGDEKYRAKD